MVSLWTHRAAGREPAKENRGLPPAGPWEAQAVSGTRQKVFCLLFFRKVSYSTVTLLARLRGLSTSQPRSTAM